MLLLVQICSSLPWSHQLRRNWWILYWSYVSQLRWECVLAGGNLKWPDSMWWCCLCPPHPPSPLHHMQPVQHREDAAMPQQRGDPSTSRRPGLASLRLQTLKPGHDFPWGHHQNSARPLCMGPLTYEVGFALWFCQVLFGLGPSGSVILVSFSAKRWILSPVLASKDPSAWQRNSLFWLISSWSHWWGVQIDITLF